MNLPEKYMQRMRAALSDYSEYAAIFEKEPYKAVRANKLKISPSEFSRIAPFPLEGGVPWAENGFYISDERPGRSPLHDAGVFYVQEPSAMCAVPLLQIGKGDRILDLCSAPGGKGTQIAELLQRTGVVLMNEKIPDRAKILSRNVERLGIRNAVVTNEDPETLAAAFPEYFDKILVDAPCSGEGMFRKEPAAIENWSEENVAMCAARQDNILRCAAAMLRGGGRLVYSTCTFSPEEDEWAVGRFLKSHPEFILERQEKLYPHRVRGEGHFAAALVKEGEGRGAVRRHWRKADKRLVNLYRAFERDFLKTPLEGDFIAFGETLYLVPEELFSLETLRVLRAGVCLGEHVKGRFEPDHALAMSVKTSDALCAEELSDRVNAYLKGEELSAQSAGRGYCLCTYMGFPLGLGKASGGALKNRLPKGLRKF